MGAKFGGSQIDFHLFKLFQLFYVFPKNMCSSREFQTHVFPKDSNYPNCESLLDYIN